MYEGPLQLVVDQFTPVQRSSSPESITKELDGEEVEVINPLAGHSSSTSPTQPPSKKFHIQVIPSTASNFQPILSSVASSFPLPSPKSSTSRALLASPIKTSPIPKPRSSPVLTLQQLQTLASTRRRREDWSPFTFPDAQVFPKREHWPIRVSREDSTVVNEGQDAVERLFRRVDRSSREVIVYAND
ncbi:hypothetical protein O181_047355 [Austropuccinia psidii MF-1]|uniref:Uncharacterized protein n=1 Tax=Austropuccinia psidii MF-1 TaxID=1389203 RepID=A0A9Q3HN36_9BASI|nr:hypothetical protein [Austropuccinia psidii MF-1]